MGIIKKKRSGDSKEKIKLRCSLVGIPIAILVLAIARPLYFSFTCRYMTDAIIIGTQEECSDNGDAVGCGIYAVYQYEISGKTYSRTFGDSVLNPEKIVGEKRRIRVNIDNPEEIYYEIPIHFLDVILFVFGLTFLVCDVYLFKHNKI